MSQRLSSMMSSSSSLQVGVDRVVARQLGVEVLGEDLDVAGLVHHLGRRVVLGVDPRHGLDDLGRADQRALLAVHELAERPVLALDADLDPLLRRPTSRTACRPAASSMPPARPPRLAVALAMTTASWSTSVSHGRSVSPFHCERLGLLVEAVELGAAALLVVPGEDGVGVVLDRVDGLVDVGVGDGEDGLEVVDVGAADELFVGAHVGLPGVVRGRCRRAGSR